MRMRSLELVQLLSEGRSLSAAARSLGVSQPAASKMLQQLEHELGLTLFLREHGRLVATAEAQRMLPEFARTIDSIALVHEAAREMKDSTRGALTFASTPTVAEVMVAGALTAFCKQFPQVRVWMQVMAKRQVLEAAQNGRVDMAVVNAPFEAPMLESRKLLSAAAVCFMQEGHPLTQKQTLSVDDIGRYTVISHLHSSVIQDFFGPRAAVEGLDHKIKISINHTATALRLVQDGVGIALTDPLVDDPPGLVRRAVEPFIEISPHAVYRKDRPFSLTMRSLLQHLENAARHQMERGVAGIDGGEPVDMH